MGLGGVRVRGGEGGKVDSTLTKLCTAVARFSQLVRPGLTLSTI